MAHRHQDDLGCETGVVETNEEYETLQGEHAYSEEDKELEDTCTPRVVRAAAIKRL